MNEDQLFDFFLLTGKSKTIKRSGWVREHVKNPESVAEHSFRLIIFALVLAPLLKLNQEKLIKMALLHDLAEVKTGDLVVDRAGKTDEKAKERKEQLEYEGIQEIFTNHPHRQEYIAIFHEMLERKTELAKLFKQLDKLEMALQAFEYEKEQEIDLTEFFVDANVYITEPLLKKIFEKLLSTRAKSRP